MCYNAAMKYLCALALLCALAASAPALYNVKVPDLVAGSHSAYETRLKESDKLAGSSEREVQKARYGGRDYFVVKTIGRAERENIGKLTTLTTAYYLINPDGSVSVYSYEGESTKNGQPFTYFKLTFDWPARAAGWLFKFPEKKLTKAKTIELTENTVYASDLAPYLQACLQSDRLSGKLKLIIPTGDTYNMTYQIKAPENNAIRVDLKPDMGIFSGIIPTIAFWFQAAAPHQFVRYEGPESGPFSPTIVQERIK